MVSSAKLSFILFFACSLFVQGTLGEVICESLPKEQCAFAVSSSGKRCKLTNGVCHTVDVVVEGLSGHVETDECFRACGVSREEKEVTPEDFTPEFLKHLCSPDCFENCPNILELYFNFAAGEGMFLPALCDPNKAAEGHGRTMAEVLKAAAGPAAAPAKAPSAAAAGPSAGGYVDDDAATTA